MNKLKKIDEINDAFIEVMQEEGASEYVRFIKAINRELIDNIDKLTPDRVRQIVMRQDLNIEDATLLFAILDAILHIIKAPSKKNDMLAPVLGIMALYSLSQPKQFVRRIVKINKGKNLSANEKKARGLLTKYKQLNKKSLEDIHQRSMMNMKASLAKSNKSNQLLDDFFKLRQEGKKEKEIRNILTKKYNDINSINRTLRTELRAQSEFVKLEQSKTMGYTHKIWKTQQDERVRKTNFHKQVANEKIGIDDTFTHGTARAQAPGDESLPPNDRINCRCYLIYV